MSNSYIWNTINNYIKTLDETGHPSWCLTIRMFSSYYKIYPENVNSNKIVKIDKMEIDLYSFDLNVNSIRVLNNLLLIPIELNGITLFYLMIEGVPYNSKYDILKLTIELLIREESANIQEYPTFLPFIFPIEDTEIQKINHALEQKENFFFLNGLRGTGRHTFIKNHLIYCYGENIQIPTDLNISDPGKIQKFHGNTKTVLVVDELAYCMESDQAKLLNEFKEMRKDVILFVCSGYDPGILSSREVIGLELAELCIKYRIIFPSIHKRSEDLYSILKEYMLLKGINMPSICSEDWLKRQDGSGGFKEILGFFQNYFKPQPSIMNLLNNGISLRDVVKGNELMAIEYAISIIGKSQNKIARFLGISRGSLQHKLKKYNYAYNEWEE